ncbi:MAG: MATE family efflux transporter, partial [Oscillospiraceae bacterium]
MKKYFCNKKFRSLLFTGSVTTIIQYLLILSDTIVVGQILGEQELAAINVVKPFHSVAIFLASLISIGTSVFYSYEIGEFNKDKANALFGQGIILSVGSGLLMLVIGVFGKTPYFNYLALSENVASSASDYFFFYQFVIMLLPLYTVLLEMVYSDGDGLICNISSAVQIIVNVAASVFFCFKLGILGVGLGTFLGLICSISVLFVHFFRKQNSLRFVWHVSIKDTLKVMKCGITDSSAYLFIGLTSFTATKFVVYMFGEYYLPVLLMVFNVIELTIVFDGIGQAVTPIVNIYRGEDNHVGIKRVMKTALIYAIAEGVTLSLLLFLFGSQIAELFGLTDKELIDLGRIAVCLISP